MTGNALLAIASAVSAQAPDFSAEQRAEGEALVGRAARSIANTAREPSSVTFRRVFIQKRAGKDGRQPIVLCGEVNGKNGYGGFTGFQAFILVGDTVHVGRFFGLDVAYMCRNGNPTIDTRDYAPEMKGAFDAAIGTP